MEDVDSLNATTDMDTSSDEDNEHILDENEITEEPKIGMLFSSREDVYDYYNNYAKKEGFGIAKRSLIREDDGMVKYFTIACSRAGTRIEGSKSSLRPNLSSKTKCKAKIRSTLQKDGRYMLSTVVLEHNHTLSPGKTRFFRCNKSLNINVKRRLELNDQAGISVSKNFNSFVVEAGGYENLTFGEKDCRNYIEKARRLRLGEGDAQAVCKYFVRMQNINSNFFYVMDFDEKNRIRNLFWADARSRAAYEAFGEVVTFDTTYLTNRYEMPFAPFVGVNHHGQSILLGCGLVSREDTETFVWLFQSWLACMSNCPPKAIITDQCKAMRKAVEIVFPNTRHRWCLWHIMKKIPHKLSGYSQYETIKASLQNVVYDSFTKDEFEEGWEGMLNKYGLQDNEWLRGLYDERYRWVPIYVKDTFWAGMSTTQRSESMNAFFDGYVNAKTSLKQFVEQYDNALKDKIEKENRADFESFSKRYQCVTMFDIEKQFQEAYTNTKFKEFQEELKKMMYCQISLVKEEDSIFTYEVAQQVKIGDRWKNVIFLVEFNELKCEAKCMCNLFEFKGILCGHTLFVLTQRSVKEVPAKYILSRWRKGLKREYNFVNTNYDDLRAKPNRQRYDKLCNKFYEVAKIVVDSEERFNILMSNMCQLMDKFVIEDSVYRDNQTPEVALVASPKSGDDNNEISKESSRVLSPLVGQRVGRPKLKRKESKLDEGIRLKMKGRKKKQQVEDGGTRMQKQKGSSQKKVLKKGEIDDEVELPTSSRIINELGTQESVNANSGSFLGGSYVVVPSTSNQSQGHLTQVWRGGYGMEMGNLNLLQNLSQGHLPSPFWTGSYNGLHEYHMQGVRFYPNMNQQP